MSKQGGTRMRNVFYWVIIFFLSFKFKCIVIREIKKGYKHINLSGYYLKWFSKSFSFGNVMNKVVNVSFQSA